MAAETKAIKRTVAKKADEKKADELHVPNREEISEKIMAALSNGQKLENLRAPDILGITQARIDAAERANQPFTAPTIDDYFRRSRSTLGQQINEGTHLTVAGAGSRDFIQAEVARVFEDRGIYGVMEINPCPGDKRLLRYMPDGLLLMQFPEVYSDETVTYEGETFNIVAKDILAKFEASAKWTIITAPWAGSTQPVAAVKTADDGAHKSMVVFLSMFSTATGKRWIRTAGTANMDHRREALGLIIEAAQKHLTGLRIKPNQNNDDARIREAHSSFTAVKTLGVAALGAVETELKDAKKRLPKMQDDIDNAQAALIKALRDEQDLREKVELLGNNREERIMAGLTTAFAAMDSIKNLRGVTKCEFRQYRNQTALYVETKDHVVKANAAGTDRRYIKGLKFYLMMGRDVYTCIHFDDTDCPTRTVHPHVMAGNRVCWGQAALPISNAIGRNDWVSAVNLVIRWALQYSYNDHHTHTDFPKTDKETGWVD